MVDLACKKLYGACNAQDSAENALKILQAQANASEAEITALREHVCSLEQQVAKSSQDLVEMSKELEEETGELAELKASQQTVYRARDAWRKRIARMNKNKPQTPECLVSSNQQSQRFHLKDQAGVIRPEVRDMLRNLACEGVSIKRASNIINIIANGLGVDISGSISARTVSRVMLEGLVQAQMQVAHELDSASCE